MKVSAISRKRYQSWHSKLTPPAAQPPPLLYSQHKCLPPECIIYWRTPLATSIYTYSLIKVSTHIVDITMVVCVCVFWRGGGQQCDQQHTFVDIYKIPKVWLRHRHGTRVHALSLLGSCEAIYKLAVLQWITWKRLPHNPCSHENHWCVFMWSESSHWSAPNS